MKLEIFPHMACIYVVSMVCEAGYLVPIVVDLGSENVHIGFILNLAWVSNQRIQNMIMTFHTGYSISIIGVTSGPWQDLVFNLLQIYRAQTTISFSQGLAIYQFGKQTTRRRVIELLTYPHCPYILRFPYPVQLCWGRINF